MASRILSMQGRLELWAGHAHDVLTETAQVLHLAITDADLVRLVQERSGEHSDMPARGWLPKVLRLVAQRASDAGEPPLTSLVVRGQDHKVGPDYDAALSFEGIRPANEAEREQLAAEGRLECYRRYAANVPQDEQPRLSPVTALTSDTRGLAAPVKKVSRPRAPRAPRPSTSTKPVVVEREPVICMSCFLQIPANGICPNCS